MPLVFVLLGALRASLRTRTDLALENLALRQQLVLLRRRSKRRRCALLGPATQDVIGGGFESQIMSNSGAAGRVYPRRGRAADFR